MKEIVIASGKGGTGKTSITAALAYLAGQSAVVTDCDVDAPDLHILLQPKIEKRMDFFGGKEAVIDKDKCISCGKCEDACEFGAPFKADGSYHINSRYCEGCGLCSHICPAEAISMEFCLSGEWYVSRTRIDSLMVHAKLGIGEENSGKLVAAVRNQAGKAAKKANADLIITDGAPGIGCPVISSVTGADYLVIVTEPSLSGFHDMKRLEQLASKMSIKMGCVINKSTLNEELTGKIQSFLKEKEIDLIAMIPYTSSFTKAMIAGKTIVETGDIEVQHEIQRIFKFIKEI